MKAAGRLGLESILMIEREPELSMPTARDVPRSKVYRFEGVGIGPVVVPPFVGEVLEVPLLVTVVVVVVGVVALGLGELGDVIDDILKGSQVARTLEHILRDSVQV